MFPFGFIKAFDSKGILNTLNKGITSAMECPDKTVFTFTMTKESDGAITQFAIEIAGFNLVMN